MRSTAGVTSPIGQSLPKYEIVAIKQAFRPHLGHVLPIYKGRLKLRRGKTRCTTG